MEYRDQVERKISRYVDTKSKCPFEKLVALEGFLDEGGVISTEEQFSCYMLFGETLVGNFNFEWFECPEFPIKGMKLLRYDGKNKYQIWGYDRVLNALNSIADGPINDLVTSVFDELYRFVNEPPGFHPLLEYFYFEVKHPEFNSKDLAIIDKISNTDKEEEIVRKLGIDGFDVQRTKEYLSHYADISCM